MIERKMDRLKDFIKSNYKSIVLTKDEAKIIYEMYLEYKKMKGENKK